MFGGLVLNIIFSILAVAIAGVAIDVRYMTWKFAVLIVVGFIFGYLSGKDTDGKEENSIS